MVVTRMTLITYYTRKTCSHVDREGSGIWAIKPLWWKVMKKDSIYHVKLLKIFEHREDYVYRVASNSAWITIDILILLDSFIKRHGEGEKGGKGLKELWKFSF